MLHRAFIVAALAALALAVPAGAVTGSVDAARESRLASGEIFVEPVSYPGSALPGARLEAIVDAPPAAVWRVIDECGRYKEAIPRIKESEELSRFANVVRCRIVLETPWPLKNLEAVTRAQHTFVDGVYRRTWTLERGDYTKNEGSWTIAPFDADGTRTRIVYEVHTVPSVKVPSFLQDYAQKRGLPAIVHRLRARVAQLLADASRH